MELQVIPVHLVTQALLDLSATRVNRVQQDLRELQVPLGSLVTPVILVTLDRLEHQLLLSLL